MDDSVPAIYVLAGVNGAGKSSVAGKYLKSFGMDWYNPDAMADLYRTASNFPVSIQDANLYAWQYGYNKLCKAITNKLSYSFETTLGGNSITEALKRASNTHDIHVLFCGLASVELHLERVRKRVSEGGHDIPETTIKKRWVSSRQHLIDLMPYLASLRVFDNSAEQDPALPLRLHRIIKVEKQILIVPDKNNPAAMRNLPEWARPIAMRALS